MEKEGSYGAMLRPFNEPLLMPYTQVIPPMIHCKRSSNDPRVTVNPGIHGVQASMEVYKRDNNWATLLKKT